MDRCGSIEKVYEQFNSICMNSTRWGFGEIKSLPCFSLLVLVKHFNLSIPQDKVEVASY